MLLLMISGDIHFNYFFSEVFFLLYLFLYFPPSALQDCIPDLNIRFLSNVVTQNRICKFKSEFKSNNPILFYSSFVDWFYSLL